MDITRELKINADASTIYQAVATEKGITGWWSKDCKVGELVGDSSTLKFDKQGTIVTMGFETEVLEPNSKVVWKCTENANPAWINTQIVTEITETENGCNVIFSHAGFDSKWEGQEAFEMTKQGWQHFVSSLVSYCENGTGQPW